MKYSRCRARSRRRSSVRAAGIVVRSLAFLTLLAACVAAIRWITSETRDSAHQFLESSANSPRSVASLAGPQAYAVQARNRRPVYPYSVVPGGVDSAAELRTAAEYDPTVGDHYRGFDYSHVRVVEVKEPRLVYLSYRKGDKVYWTRKQASLHKGEKLLTDGKITARTRCGNQVSVLPQAQTAPEEPTEAQLDRPDAVASGMQSFPTNFESSLLNVDPALPAGPSSPGSVGGVPVGGLPPGGFIPPPIGGTPGTPINNGCVPTPNKPCQNQPPPPPAPPPPPPPTVPEPGTLLLVGSGAAAILARFRGKARS